MRTLETEYEYTQALLKQNGHVRLYPADPSHIDHAFGYGDGLSISPACQAYIDQELDKWLPTDSMNCHIELTGGNPERTVEIMFNKHIVNFCYVSNQVAQYAIAKASDSSYRKLHSRFLGTVEYLEVQENGVGCIHNYVTNMQFSSDMMERQHSSFLISAVSAEAGGLRHVHV